MCSNIKRTVVSAEDPELRKIFEAAKAEWREQPGANRRRGIDNHIFAGLSVKAKKQGEAPRLSKLCAQAFIEAQEMATSPSFKGAVMPSPLGLMYQALTVPEEPQTAAFAALLIRSVLFEVLGIHPATPLLKKNYPHFEPFNEHRVLDSLASFEHYVEIQGRWPDRRSTDPLNQLVGHVLSLKGVTHLWFESTASLQSFCAVHESQTDSSLRNRYASNLYFRQSHSIIGLPQAGEIINFLFGIPMPFRGGDILFLGGLKKSDSGGLVVSLSGRPGVGKTSVALSLGVQLACMGTSTVYLSLEEAREDLFSRMTTLIPSYMKSLSIYKRSEVKEIESTRWLGIHNIERTLSFKTMREVVEQLHDSITETMSPLGDSGGSVPSCCPLCVIIDNLNEAAAGFQPGPERYEEVEKFIQNCRSMGAVVIVLSADDVPERLSLDYLVDVAMTLRQEGTDKRTSKPVRVLSLTKTRHQISRQGAHLFHLSGKSGFRISPQIPSQLDLREIRRKHMPNFERSIHTLNIIGSNTPLEYMCIRPGGRILIHGYGSAGKAGLALKLVMSPSISASTRTKQILRGSHDFGSFEYRAKILVLSFLYPREYYLNLVDRTIFPSLRKSYKGIRRAQVDVESFSAGFLSPEDFAEQVVRAFDRAILEGDPYTGIVIDGLHNVFLQFKALQDEDMVWPLLYDIFSRYRITVVSTFTNFSLNDKLVDFDPSTRNLAVSQSLPDHMLMQKGQTPFLHTLVKAADYFFLLEEKIMANYDHRYFLSVKSAINQKIPTNILEWDRTSCEFLEEIQPGNLSDHLRY